MEPRRRICCSRSSTAARCARRSARAEAGLDKAAADYQTTVLGAFQNVADSLHALELDAENLRAQSEAERSAQQSLDLVRIQYKDGAASYLAVLDATRQYQTALIGLIQARAARLADTAALYAALGGSLESRRRARTRRRQARRRNALNQTGSY